MRAALDVVLTMPPRAGGTHHRRGCAAGGKDRMHVEAPHTVVVFIARRFQRPAAEHITGVVDQSAQPSKRLHCLRDEGGRDASVQQIACQRDRGAV